MQCCQGSRKSSPSTKCVETNHESLAVAPFTMLHMTCLHDMSTSRNTRPHLLHTSPAATTKHVPYLAPCRSPLSIAPTLLAALPSRLGVAAILDDDVDDDVDGDATVRRMQAMTAPTALAANPGPTPSCSPLPPPTQLCTPRYTTAVQLAQAMRVCPLSRAA